MAKRITTIRNRNGGKWTEAEYWGKIRSSLRKLTMQWKPIQDCKKGCKEIYKGDNKRQKFVYKCANCNSLVSDKEIHIDHKVSAGSLRNSDDLKGFVDRLFAENVNMYQCLCKNCNIEKATEEKLKRKENE